MSYIPDVRNRYIEPTFKNTKRGKELLNLAERNPYYQGYLNNQDGLILDGWDYATDTLIDWAGEILGVVDEEGNTVEIGILDTLDIEDEEVLQSINDIFSEMIKSLFSSLECSRNELVVSMIDTMNDEEYEQIKARVDGEEEE